MEEVAAILRIKGIVFSIRWLQQCIKYIEINCNKNLCTATLLSNEVLRYFVDSDIYESYDEVDVLPYNIQILHNARIYPNSPRVLQIDEVVDVGASAASHSKQETTEIPEAEMISTRFGFGKHVLKIFISDGKQKVVGLDFNGVLIQAFLRYQAKQKDQSQSFYSFCAGSKILVRNALVRRGALILTAETTQFIGGNVARLQQLCILRNQNETNRGFKNNGATSTTVSISSVEEPYTSISSIKSAVTQQQPQPLFNPSSYSINKQYQRSEQLQNHLQEVSNETSTEDSIANREINQHINNSINENFVMNNTNYQNNKCTIPSAVNITNLNNYDNEDIELDISMFQNSSSESIANVDPHSNNEVKSVPITTKISSTVVAALSHFNVSCSSSRSDGDAAANNNSNSSNNLISSDSRTEIHDCNYNDFKSNVVDNLHQPENNLIYNSLPQPPYCSSISDEIQHNVTVNNISMSANNSANIRVYNVSTVVAPISGGNISIYETTCAAAAAANTTSLPPCITTCNNNNNSNNNNNNNDLFYDIPSNMMMLTMPNEQAATPLLTNDLEYSPTSAFSQQIDTMNQQQQQLVMEDESTTSVVVLPPSLLPSPPPLLRYWKELVLLYQQQQPFQLQPVCEEIHRVRCITTKVLRLKTTATNYSLSGSGGSIAPSIEGGGGGQGCLLHSKKRQFDVMVELDDGESYQAATLSSELVEKFLTMSADDYYTITRPPPLLHTSSSLSQQTTSSMSKEAIKAAQISIMQRFRRFQGIFCVSISYNNSDDENERTVNVRLIDYAISNNDGDNLRDICAAMIKQQQRHYQ